MSFDLQRTDTICAFATAPGEAAIAVVRVSGARADELRQSIFRPRRGPQRPFVMTLGDVVDGAGALLDEALCTSFPAGRSYTGECMFELSIHGSPSRVHAVTKALVEQGCRPAEPGELTLRAVLTGRLDLAAAEAVDHLIRARSDAAARAALRTLRGGLAQAITPIREALVDVLAELEARLDFPDEDLGDAARGRLRNSLRGAAHSLQRLLSSARYGQRLAQGARVVLFGPPNAGKSTLLNALVGEERAIVHESPGTTRDVLEAQTVFQGVPATLVDVAGLRGGDLHPVERMGIERAMQERDRADVVVALVPAQEPDASVLLLELAAQRDTLLVLSKCDLGGETSLPDTLRVSAKSGEGLMELRWQIAQRLVLGAANDEEVVLQNARQEVAVQECAAALDDAIGAIDAMPDEVTASELRRAARALDRLLGRDVSADVLDAIFSRFCIGK